MLGFKIVEAAVELNPPLKVWRLLHIFVVVVPYATDTAPPEFCKGYENVSADCLLLNVVQSAAESTPADVAEDVAEDMTGVDPPDEERGYVAVTDVTPPEPVPQSAPVPVIRPALFTWRH